MNTALVEPLAVAWHAVNMSPLAQFQKGDYCLILGGGPIGLSVIKALKARGHGTIIVSEVSSKRKEFAKEFGADFVLDPTKDDIPERCKEICGGRGVHCVFDAAGVQAGLDSAVLALRARGTLINIAIWEKDCRIVPNQFCFREKTYKGVATYVLGDFEEVLEASAGGVSLPLDMKRGETSIRDLRTVVRHSSLHSKNELVLEFDGFIETARIASWDLQRFNSHVGHSVDKVLATARWTRRVLEDISIRDASQGTISAFVNRKILAPFQPLQFTESALADQYIQHSRIIEDEINLLVQERPPPAPKAGTAAPARAPAPGRSRGSWPAPASRR